MNKQELKKAVGTIVKLRPRPLLDNTYVPEPRNRWDILSESEDKKGLVLQNTIMDKEFVLGYDSIREFRMPDLLVLRGQLTLRNDGTVAIEPFVEAPDTDTTEESVAILAERWRLAETEIERLTLAEKAGLRELLVRDKMTDTDLSLFFDSRGLGPYPEFYKSVSTKTSFLDREFSGYNAIIPAFRPILMKLLMRDGS